MSKELIKNDLNKILCEDLVKSHNNNLTFFFKLYNVP